ncbi:ATP-dependent DNA helicase [Steroidobacter sp. S1-65]|uniref:ATP-dependent DNA helicase n=1 Tax=Steroidobacter gossypii TaxID=2805490 RepID=A0ABS1X4G4_9GAMM|nr:ATP-dependent DNA helicase [Steroidobacter gossypii]MBM0108100.1 ATP-dependent DNA helicase [Steroidobacter gossypii]
MSVAVRVLCQFTAKRGDLDLRFTPAPSAREGIAGHGIVAARRGREYEAEKTLEAVHDGLHVRGRADGYDKNQRRLDECKTFRGELSRMPENHRELHWAQAKMYGAMLCRQQQLSELRLALVYFDVDSEEETVLTQDCSAEELQTFFEQHCSRYAVWGRSECAHREARDQALQSLAFPFDFYAAQRQLAEAVYRVAVMGEHLLAQAPTGVGKTMGTLFPMLKAMGAQKIDRIFYLTAKTTGRQLALDALRALIPPEVKLRVLEITAREKICKHPDAACHGESCPLAKKFYDRLPDARAAALERGTMTRAVIDDVAAEHRVCPYFLSQELARWSDVIIGDYNYYFDQSAFLYGLALEQGWRVGVLVDEAHNLVERARRMYSASLDAEALRRARKESPPMLRGVIQRLSTEFQRIADSQEAPYRVYDNVPKTLLKALDTYITEQSALADQAMALPEPVQQLFFDALAFNTLAMELAEHSLFEIAHPEHATFSIRNVVPAPFLRPRFDNTRSVVLFSATLTPRDFYLDLLGLPETTRWLDVDSPFSADQLEVRVARHISTRYRHRDDSITPMVELIVRQFERRPGNYFMFASSFDYLARIAEGLDRLAPHIPNRLQRRNMSESERQQFLDGFEAHGRGIALAVLGGAFGEGVDLPGERMIGAFIATLGLPQLNDVSEQMRLRLDQLFEDGYAYTYLYPGLQKVIQAAGRVIRTRHDRGVVYLIDDRFARREVRELLPKWWRLQTMPV